VRGGATSYSPTRTQSSLRAADFRTASGGARTIRTSSTHARLLDALGERSVVAREICGECVPRRYAADLRYWMDQIQHEADRLI
jgi:hypothetical protein